MYVKDRKIAIMGFSCVGKTSLAKQFILEKFDEECEPNIEIRYEKNIQISQQIYRVCIVDTARHSNEFFLVPVLYAIEIHGYCLVYSIDDRKSFEVVQNIYEKLLVITGKVVPPIILVGNKVDRHSYRCVSTREGRSIAYKMGADFMEVSAAQTESVNGLFVSMLLSIDGCSLYERQLSRRQIPQSIKSGRLRESQNNRESTEPKEMVESKAMPPPIEIAKSESDDLHYAVKVAGKIYSALIKLTPFNVIDYVVRKIVN